MGDRRQFLKQLAGAGALIATSRLPLFATDRPEIFPGRGRYERLSLSYAVVNIGLAEPFSLLHISDSHLTAAYGHEGEKKQTLTAQRTQTFGGMQEQALQDALAWAKQHVEFIVHTGDLIDWHSEANFDLVRKFFPDGLVGCIGNHEFSPDMKLSEPPIEKTEDFKKPLRKAVQDAFPFDISFQSQVVHGVNFITLDDVFGYVTKKQVRKFKKEVRKGLPIVLCMHVPFYSEDMWRANYRFWKCKAPMTDAVVPAPTGDYKTQLEDPVTREFIAYLKQEPLLKCILTGHAHFSFDDAFSPTCRQYVTAGGFLFHGREVIFI